jgi:hypothetical protein
MTEKSNVAKLSQPTPLEQSSHFSSLDNCTLELLGMVASHSTHIFRASCSAGSYAKLHFAYVYDIDIVIVMTNVRLRMATQEENESLMGRMTKRQTTFIDYPYSEMGFALCDSHLAIDCSEGTFFIWARYLDITWLSTPDLDLLAALAPNGQPYWDFSRPLWKGGPPLTDL